MKKISLMFFGFAFTVMANAQVNNNPDVGGASKVVYAELGGGGIVFSANFDSRFKGNNGLGYRAGIGFRPTTNKSIITFPLGINTLIGRGPSYLEAEVTITPSTAKTTLHKRTSSILIFPHIGYRYSKPASSFNFRIYGGPLIIAGGVLPWAGLSFGYTLRK